MSHNENHAPLVPAELRQALIALNADLRISRNRICRVAKKLQNDSTVGDLLAGFRDGRQRSMAEQCLGRAETLANTELEKCRALGAQIVTQFDPAYPVELAELQLPPPVLYIRGRLEPGVRLAIVGSRHADAWALESASQIASAATSGGFSVVSGFALGVDIAAHRAAVFAGGSTIAVLGCGLAARYPRQHHGFSQTIAESGAVVTELPFHAEPKAQNFPVRNRIIAALSRCTLVAQAALRSGALITARYAADLGRTVMAVPGRPVDARSAGANLLLRDGALVALEPADVLVTLGLDLGKDLSPQRSTRKGGQKVSGAVQVLDTLRGAEGTLDELVIRLDRAASSIQSDLLQLELDGLVSRKAGLFRVSSKPSR